MSQNKSAKLSPTQTAYLLYLDGRGERPAGVAIGNVENALKRRGLIEDVRQENGTYRSVPTPMAAQYL